MKHSPVQRIYFSTHKLGLTYSNTFLSTIPWLWEKTWPQYGFLHRIQNLGFSIQTFQSMTRLFLCNILPHWLRNSKIISECGKTTYESINYQYNISWNKLLDYRNSILNKSLSRNILRKIMKANSWNFHTVHSWLEQFKVVFAKLWLFTLAFTNKNTDSRPIPQSRSKIFFTASNIFVLSYSLVQL